MLAIVVIFAPVAIFGLCIIYDHFKWSMCNRIYESSDPVSLIKKYSWAGFRRQTQSGTLSNAVTVGLISKVEFLGYARQYHDVDIGWRHVIWLEGTWFRGNVEQIGFRFELFSNKLIEIKFIYKNITDPIYKKSPKERYEEELKYLNNIPNWQEFVGIGINEEDKVEITVFTTPK